MRLFKFIKIAISAILIGNLAIANAVLAAESTSREQELKIPLFYQITGIIEAIEARDHGVYYSVKAGDDPCFLIVTNETQIYDNTGEKTTLQKGDKITAYTYSKKPTILIYPPHYNPEIVIVETEKIGTAQVGTFDENLLDQEISLQLHVSEETDVSSFTGKEITKEDLTNQHLLVFYKFVTKSIPAQTTPHKIVVIDHLEQEEEGSPMDFIESIMANDFYDVDGAKMVPLRLIAEKLQFRVEATIDGAILTKGTESYTLTRGSKIYHYNDALRYLETAPALLEPGKTYVPVSFIYELIDAN